MNALKLEELPHYTYEDYKHWEGPWEIIHGIPYAMAPAPRRKHQYVLKKLAFQIEQELEQCSKCELLLSPHDWKIEEDTVVEPDLMIICYALGDVFYLTEPPELVVEILSPHNREKDLITKFDLYKKQKVKYYLVIDADLEQATIFQYQDDAYQQVKELNTESFEFELSKCKFSIDFSHIWANF